ncbi:hypothetical protein M948_11425 [Virgibacillus sp. CM-4]|uniref:membrane lipoprotein lipid attachment site-containing protein n=1 Tax=Virgibacillus sp. CM-4 TaxID=1354277 RepID=UPI0003883B01|nr:membrane lipoprotein lipid attachment site-containing protein [Virgibacillus sp. CM-4]EQB37029.1 hypothetical protein M948_11425 [Virgibacillus sp. CM-4]
MKKIIVFVCGLLLLTACSNHESAASVSEESSQPTIKTTSALQDLPEYPIIRKNVDLEIFELKIVADNPYKRVILIENNTSGEKEYKSIYIKKTNRLKLIQFNEGLLYNGIVN